MVEPLACVVRGIEESWIGRGQSVAVIGAGPIGLMFLVLARMRGAHVVVARRNPRRLEKARELGAEATLQALADVDLAKKPLQRSPSGEGAHGGIEAGGPARNLRDPG